jgi:hypothetical protein
MINHHISFLIFVWELLDYDNFMKSYFEKSHNEMSFIFKIILVQISHVY